MTDSSFEFILSKEIGYQNQDGYCKTNRLLLIEPSLAKYEDAFFTLKSLITSGIMNQKSASTNNSQKINNEDSVENKKKEISDFLNDKKQMKLFVMMSLNSLSSNEYKRFRDIFYREILCCGCCLVDGKVEMTKSNLDEICVTDRENLICEYCVNFLSPSWLGGA